MEIHFLRTMVTIAHGAMVPMVPISALRRATSCVVSHDRFFIQATEAHLMEIESSPVHFL